MTTRTDIPDRVMRQKLDRHLVQLLDQQQTSAVVLREYQVLGLDPSSTNVGIALIRVSFDSQWQSRSRIVSMRSCGSTHKLLRHRLKMIRGNLIQTMMTMTLKIDADLPFVIGIEKPAMAGSKSGRRSTFAVGAAWGIVTDTITDVFEDTAIIYDEIEPQLVNRTLQLRPVAAKDVRRRTVDTLLHGNATIWHNVDDVDPEADEADAVAVALTASRLYLDSLARQKVRNDAKLRAAPKSRRRANQDDRAGD